MSQEAVRSPNFERPAPYRTAFPPRCTKLSTGTHTYVYEFKYEYVWDTCTIGVPSDGPHANYSQGNKGFICSLI
eukprot:scaffold389276_cov15-Prasinocladus_malaysianus.AAC.1